MAILRLPNHVLFRTGLPAQSGFFMAKKTKNKRGSRINWTHLTYTGVPIICEEKKDISETLKTDLKKEMYNFNHFLDQDFYMGRWEGNHIYYPVLPGLAALIDDNFNPKKEKGHHACLNNGYFCFENFTEHPRDLLNFIKIVFIRKKICFRDRAPGI